MQRSHKNIINHTMMTRRSYLHTYLANNKPRVKLPSSSLSSSSSIPSYPPTPPEQGSLLSSLLLDLSKTSSILHTGSDIKGYSRPLTSVVSKEATDIFDDRKLFYGVIDSVSNTERDLKLKTIDLSKKVSETIQPQRQQQQQQQQQQEAKAHIVESQNMVHKMDAVTLFTSNEHHVKKKEKTSQEYVKKLSDNKESDGIKVDLDSVLSFLNKNVR